MQTCNFTQKKLLHLHFHLLRKIYSAKSFFEEYLICKPDKGSNAEPNVIVMKEYIIEYTFF